MPKAGLDERKCRCESSRTGVLACPRQQDVCGLEPGIAIQAIRDISSLRVLRKALDGRHHQI